MVSDGVQIARARLQAIRRAASRNNVRFVSLDAPHGGLNTRDALNSMDETDAIVLENWFPKSGGLESRNGHSQHATGVGTGDVWTIAEYLSGSKNKLIAFSDTGAFDATSTGAASSLKSGLTSHSGPRDWFMFEGEICFLDGVNAPQKYDGTTWSALTVSGGISATPIGGNSYKSRSYFWDDNSQDIWYSALNTLGGTLTKFRLGLVFGFGGKLVGMSTWTRDGGEGQDDFAVFIFSSGQIAVYSGLDPGDTTWSLVGVYDMAKPLSRDSIIKFGGDLAVLTEEDIILLTAETLRAGTTRRLDARSKIMGAVRDLANKHSANTGWVSANYPKGEMLVFNVPVTSGTRYDQLVMNTATRAWTKFTGLNGRGWGLFGGNLYFGKGDGTIHKFDDTEADAGSGIALECETAWSKLKTNSNKRITAVKPVIRARGSVNLDLGVAFDYGSVFTSQPVSSESVGAAWDTATWDVDDWAPDITLKSEWLTTTGMGVDISTRLRGNIANMKINWYRTDYMFVPGGFF